MLQPLKPKQAAARLGCGIDQLRLLEQAGEIKSINIGLGKIRQRRVYQESEIEAFIARRSSNQTKPQSRAPKPTAPSREWV